MQETIASKCKDNAKSYAEYKKGGEEGIFPYDRHLDVRDEELRLLAVLGDIGENVDFVDKTYSLSMNKLQKQKRCKVRDNVEDFMDTPDEVHLHNLREQKRKEEAPAKQKLDVTKSRYEWLKFLKVWISNSKLFHADYPKSFHRNHFILRNQKLAFVIYHYLHENSILYQQILQDVDRRRIEGETIFGDEWMDGQWFPSANQIDPACSSDEPSKSLFFPLSGKCINK